MPPSGRWVLLPIVEAKLSAANATWSGGVRPSGVERCAVGVTAEIDDVLATITLVRRNPVLTERLFDQLAGLLAEAVILDLSEP